MNAKAGPWETHERPGGILVLSFISHPHSSPISQDPLAHFSEGEREAESPHPARGQTRAPSYVLLPPCAAPWVGVWLKRQVLILCDPLPPSDSWPAGGGQPATPGSSTTRKSREGNC